MAEPDEWVRHSQAARLLRGLADELEASQWRTPEQIVTQQGIHLARVVRHARERVPFYADRLAGLAPGTDGRIDPSALEHVPLLGRAEAQRSVEQLVTTPPPDDHGVLSEMSTSGSTGRPLRVTVTESELMYRRALSIRRHRWSGRDARRSLAAIRFVEDSRAAYPQGLTLPAWHSPVRFLEPTGPMHLLDIDTPVSEQLEWLARVAPAYLITYPSNLHALLELSARTGTRPDGLDLVTTMSEALPDGLRAMCREVWGVQVLDSYSSIECGAIATQCPEADAYHVHDEMMIVEIVDGDGHAVEVGELGQVVVTPLFNHAMGLVRYALGDFAVRGAPCACGRGLSVIDQVAGRVRNMLLRPDGDRVWPRLSVRSFAGSLPIEQFQIAQTGLHAIEARLVVSRPLRAEEEAEICAYLRGRLRGDYVVAVRHVATIPRGSAGKYEDFVCEIGAADQSPSG